MQRDGPLKRPSKNSLPESSRWPATPARRTSAHLRCSWPAMRPPPSPAPVTRSTAAGPLNEATSPSQAGVGGWVRFTLRRLRRIGIAKRLRNPILAGNYGRMGTATRARPWVRLCTSVLAGGGLVLFAFGLGGGMAQAAPAPAPDYHWCPGDQWDPGLVQGLRLGLESLP